jgi:hypothetical protein
MESSSTSDFFEKFGLEVTAGEVKVGQTYPIYGMITKFLGEESGHVEIEINFSIRAHVSVPDIKKIELLKQRAFEPGIFVSTVISNDEYIVVNCSTVVFGKRQEYHA